MAQVEAGRDPDCALCLLLPYGACDWHRAWCDGEAGRASATAEPFVVRRCAVEASEGDSSRAPGTLAASSLEQPSAQGAAQAQGSEQAS
ncbi:MAG TPA: hypothetical protein VKU89_11315 [Solirubrobacteraceae bacterium]|nr:hypothetical protein [Solirubrobacteraceae bacterium]